MKTTLYFISLLVAYTLFSCHPHKETTTATQPPQETTNNINYEFKDITKGDSLFASIRRGACFGQCPVYTMKIYNGGTVVLEGKNFIDKIGTYTKHITKEQMYTFVQKAKEINYMQMDDNYDNKNITDLPATETSIVIDGKRKKVRKRFGFPKELVQFEKLFDELLKTDDWKKVEKADKF